MDREKFYLEETDPRQLHRRANDLELDGLLKMAEVLRARATWLENRTGGPA